MIVNVHNKYVSDSVIFELASSVFKLKLNFGIHPKSNSSGHLSPGFLAITLDK
jgi:hypothetical protein